MSFITLCWYSVESYLKYTNYLSKFKVTSMFNEGPKINKNLFWSIEKSLMINVEYWTCGTGFE